MKENISHTFCFQDLQDGTGMDKSRSASDIKVRLSPCLLMNLYLILHYYNCTPTTLSYHFRNIYVETNDGIHLDSLDALGPGRRILKNMHLVVDSQTVVKYSAIFFPNLKKDLVKLM